MPAFSNVSPIFQADKVRPDDFSYKLPQHKIAEYPVEPRDESKMMVLHRESGEIEHKIFNDIKDYFCEGDVLVLNNTQVFIWEVSVEPARKVRIGNSLIFGENLICDVIDNTVSSGRVISFHKNGYDLKQVLGKLGEAPLPPYIRRRPEPKDKITYQTVFAETRGSVVAPCAGMHFTEALLEDLESMGVRIAKITVHLGVHSYDPITISDLSKYSLNAEYYHITEKAAETINAARRSDNRIIVAGASTVRALETSQFEGIKGVPREGWTDLFVYPPHHFHIADGLITNFHQPQSSTMIMQYSFYGQDNLMEVYQK
ncbi:MAG: S-adenosylmethionine:tRNA ribosyltransferase-isomerase, partial [Calditrichota bacterium]